MIDARRTVVGIGELLWDLFPDGAKLGGAPANFAYHAAALGDNGIAVSRLGEDDLGREANQRLVALRLPTEHVQNDPDHPTGTVKVTLDAKGQPNFTITRDVAWDGLEWSFDLASLAAEADCVCFGSLAQRSYRSRETIRTFLRATKESCIKIFDVNLRQDFFTAAVLAESLEAANVAKLNDDELPRVTAALGLSGETPLEQMRALTQAFGLDLACLTRGERGCLLSTGSQEADHPGLKCDVADTVGAGDAFTAALAYHLLRGADLETICRAANRMGSWVASRDGATPPPEPSVIAEVVGERT